MAPTYGHRRGNRHRHGCGIGKDLDKDMDCTCPGTVDVQEHILHVLLGHIHAHLIGCVRVNVHVLYVSVSVRCPYPPPRPMPRDRNMFMVIFMSFSCCINTNMDTGMSTIADEATLSVVFRDFEQLLPSIQYISTMRHHYLILNGKF